MFANLIGPLLLTAILAPGGDGAVYLGCYKDPSVNARLLPGDKRNFKGTLTNLICQEHCRSKGFRYAGTEWKLECFCSDDRPSYKARADEADCNTPCDGDENDICGGNLRLSVYDTQEFLENPVADQFLGCFTDNEQRLLKGMRKDVAFQTPDFCVGFCYANGFRIAGVQYGRECFCDDVLDRSKQANLNECDSPCAGDRNVKCGGVWRLSVYYTGIPDIPHDDHYLGCYKDNATGVRLLSALRLVFKQRNTPRKCMNICYSLGYKYSGVEYGFECFCGNRKPALEHEAEENECQTPCAGDRREYCGGNWRISVYSTGSGTVQPYYPELLPIRSTDLQPQSWPAPTRAPTTGGGGVKPTTRPVTNGGTPRPTVKPATKPATKPAAKPTTRPATKPAAKPPTKPATRPGTTTKPICVKSTTQVGGKLVCKGQVIFQEDFNGPIDFENKWSNEIIMPSTPDYEFVVLNDNPKNMYIKSRRLYIKPTLMDNDKITHGRISLTNCTGQQYSEECERVAASYSILPPVESARIHTKDYFSFRYGKVEVRAKLPAGDWIVPEIWLEPRRISYGQGYRSGRIRLAMARGNRELRLEDEEIGLSKLEMGVLIGEGEEIYGRAVDWKSDSGWNDGFHNFTFIWTPDNLSFKVDNRNQISLIPPEGGRLSDLAGAAPGSGPWTTGTPIAPFDKEFYLAFGLSVGGMRDFPDDCVSGVYTKPWQNMAVKALLHFWQAKDQWYTSWNNEESALQIDRVRITAL